MRLISRSACFISSMDSSYSLCARMRETPIAQHPRMQEILVDRGEFVLENGIEERDGDGSPGSEAWGGGPGALLRGSCQRAPAFFQHFFDRFLASSAILSHAAAGIDIIGAARAGVDGGADRSSFNLLQTQTIIPEPS